MAILILTIILNANPRCLWIDFDTHSQLNYARTVPSESCKNHATSHHWSWYSFSLKTIMILILNTHDTDSQYLLRIWPLDYHLIMRITINKNDSDIHYQQGWFWNSLSSLQSDPKKSVVPRIRMDLFGKFDDFWSLINFLQRFCVVNR